MANINAVIGIFGIVLGVAMGVVRFMRPEKLDKLVAMQEKYGRGYGYLLHTLAYTVLPIVFGIIMLVTT